MANGLPPSAYYAEPLAQAQMRGAKLGMIREQRDKERAMMEAEMQAYGASSPRDLLFKKATMEREAAARKAQMDRITAFGNIMGDIGNVKKQFGPKAAKELWDTPEVQEVVTPFIKSGYDPTKEGEAFVSESPFPGLIKRPDGTMIEGMTEPGKAYIPVESAKGDYFEEVPITRKLAGKRGAEATALQKNTSFIAKTLKISPEEALQIALESKQQSREAFMMDMIKRSAGMGITNPKTLKKVEDSAGEIYDRIHGEKGESPAGEQDWLGATIGEE